MGWGEGVGIVTEEKRRVPVNQFKWKGQKT